MPRAAFKIECSIFKMSFLLRGKFEKKRRSIKCGESERAAMKRRRNEENRFDVKSLFNLAHSRLTTFAMAYSLANSLACLF